jgi:hypothetical protein
VELMAHLKKKNATVTASASDIEEIFNFLYMALADRSLNHSIKHDLYMLFVQFIKEVRLCCIKGFCYS